MNVLSKTGPLTWQGERKHLLLGTDGLSQALQSLDQSFFVFHNRDGEVALAPIGSGNLVTDDDGEWDFKGYLPALSPYHLGDPTFTQDHGVELPYIVGAMANGIASAELVEAASAAGALGMFGAAGLPLDRVEQAIDRLQASLGDKAFGSNLIHSPNEPDLEEGIVDLYIRKGVRRLSASAYLGLTLPLLKYRYHGISRDSDGKIQIPNQVIAKISRVEVAEKFLTPPPERMLQELVERGDLTSEQAQLAARMPVAEDIIAEADSGGHTDNRPALALFPTIMALRNEKAALYNQDEVHLRVGAAGGIATPASAAACFALGAAFIVTGSINQSCLESGSSDIVRGMLCQAGQADVTMAPAADMFEMGVQVQVLKWGTMFPVRAKKLYQLYRDYNSIDELPAKERTVLEKSFFRQTLEEAWRDTHTFFQTRDPRQNERAAKDPRHKMALIFRSYLGRASLWANSGVVDRKVDYQVWCGPAMGAFNQWVAGTFLAEPAERKAGLVAHNIMAGAAYLSRVNTLIQQGIALNEDQKKFQPKASEELARYFASSTA